MEQRSIEYTIVAFNTYQKYQIPPPHTPSHWQQNKKKVQSCSTVTIPSI